MTDLQKIRAERAALAERDALLEIVERALAKNEPVRPPLPRLSSHPASRRERVTKALSGPEIWMSSRDINVCVTALYGEPLTETSLYPLLTGLKNEGVLVRDGHKLALASRLI